MSKILFENIVRFILQFGFLTFYFQFLPVPSCPKHLAEIYSNYKEIAELVPKIEAENFTIEQGFRILLFMNFGNGTCQIKKYIRCKWEKNDLVNIINMSRAEVSPMIYALLQECSPVERSFSQLKNMLTKCRNFHLENVEKYFVVYFNNSFECND